MKKISPSQKEKFANKRLPILSWLVVPILGVWIATNYLVGIFQHPEWSKNPIPNLLSVTSAAPHQASQSGQIVYSWKGSGLITFWFDDGWLSQYTQAFPILQEKNFPAALAIPTKAVGWDSYLTWDQIKRLHYYGWEVTAHSRTHQCELGRIISMEDEVVGSKEDLKSQGYLTETYVTPCGESNSTIVELVKKNYLSLRTVEDGLNPLPVTDRYNLLIEEVQNTNTLEDVQEWINEASLNHSWLILMFHKFDDTGDLYSISPQNFKKIVEIVSSSGLPVVLPTQALNITKVP